MKTWLLPAILFFTFSSVLRAQSPYMAGGRAEALAGASLLLPDVWAVHNNPAALARLEHFQAGVWTERRFNLKEMSTGALAVALPMKKRKSGTLGFGLYVFGGGPYLQQQKFSLSYALPLSSRASAGIGLHLLYYHQTEPYGSKLLPLGDIAFQYSLSKHTQAALRLWNIYPVQLAEWQDERLPTIIQAGLKHEVNTQMDLHAGLLHETGQKTGLQFGLEYRPDKKVNLQAGVCTAPMAYAFGAGFRFRQVDMHLGFRIQQMLGVSPNVTFNYAPPAEE